VISLDIQSAFDCVQWKDVLDILCRKHCPKNLFHLIKSFFEERKVCLSSGAGSVEHFPSKGCAQGSVSGPSFWNIVYDELLSLKFGQNIRLSAFADDLVLYVSAPRKHSSKRLDNTYTDGSELCREADKALKRIFVWSRDRNLTFNPQKSELILLTKGRDDPLVPIVRMNGVEIKQVNTMRLLGVMIDSKLSFLDHFSTITGRAMDAVNKLTAVARNKWGLGSRAIGRFYSSVVEPVLTYGTMVWSDRGLIQRNMAKYRNVQRMALIRVARAYRTASLTGLCVITDMMPIDIKIELIEAKRCITLGKPPLRLVSNHSSRDYRPNRLFEEELLDVKRAEPYYSRPHPAIRLRPTFGVRIDADIVCVVNAVSSGEHHYVYCGTRSASGDWEAYKSMKFIAKCSPQSSEWFGAHQVLQGCPPASQVSIIFGSKLSCSGLQRLNCLSPHGCALMRHLATRNTNSLAVCNLANAKQDLVKQLLNKAIDQEVEENANPGTDIEYAHKYLDKKALTLWDNTYRESPQAITVKEFFPSVYRRKEIKYFEPNFTITQYVTGHGQFASYPPILNRRGSVLCQFCGGVDSALHRIYYCPQLEIDRPERLPPASSAFDTEENANLTTNWINTVDNLFDSF
jgi:hypothetical protein